jgi:cobyrinic acid a,c-diamide synthase
LSASAILIGAARSGSGKTTFALGLMRAFTRRGLRVSGVKCGPDYIDPAFHAAATGRHSLNLDSWAMDAPLICALAAAAGESSELIIAEGAMGLFDGAPGGAAGTGASADIAAQLGWPVLLIHDVSGQAQTAAAVICGLARHDPRLNVIGAVLNKCGSERHRKLAGEATAAGGVSVFGILPPDQQVKLPERHLGLIQAVETDDLDARLEKLADFVESNVDLERLLEHARAATPPQNDDRGAAELHLRAPPAQRIAIARDAAFSFLYPHLLEGWRRAGAEIVYFSPLADTPPPMDCDLCWLPGGYPELYAGQLAAAGNFFSGLRRFAATHPIHGECGGYMILGDSILDANGASHRMAGLLRLQTSFANRKLHLGYRRASLAEDHLLGRKGASLRGHEFHYATIVQESGAPFAYAADAYSAAPKAAGLRDGHVSGSFFHLVA